MPTIRRSVPAVFRIVARRLVEGVNGGLKVT